MAKWAQSLIRISTYEVETLQKQLAEVVTRRTQTEMRLATLEAEFEVELNRARSDPSLTAQLPAYRQGVDARKAEAQSALDIIAHEERGVRDQLGLAFESLKKFEHVAEMSKLRKMAALNKAEQAQMDETALRLSQA